MVQVDYGFIGENKLPKNADFYLLTNEDINFIANLVTATNDNIQFAIPYPSSIDLLNETIEIHRMEFLYLDADVLRGGLALQALQAYISYLKKDLTTTWRGSLTDAEDEFLKAQLAGPIFFGEQKINLTATAAVEGSEREADATVQAMYHPPHQLDMSTPIYVTLVNNAVTQALATNAITAANFTTFDKVALKIWFTKRTLTRAEKTSMMRKFLVLDS